MLALGVYLFRRNFITFSLRSYSNLIHPLLREDANNKLTASSPPHCPRSFILRLDAWPTKKCASNIRETLTLLERQGKRKSDRMDRGRRAQRETQTAVSGKRTDQTDIYIYFSTLFSFPSLSLLSRFSFTRLFAPSRASASRPPSVHCSNERHH